MSRRWFVAIAIILSMKLMSCGEGDRIKPGQIKDFIFFTDPKAVTFNGKNFALGPERPFAKTAGLAWTATGDNGEQGIAALYDIRYISTTETAAYGLAAASLCDVSNGYLHRVYGEPFPQKSGLPEALNLIPLALERGKTYYFCLWAVDEIGQYSEPAQASGQMPFLGITLRGFADSVPDLGRTASNINDFNGDGLIDVAVASPVRSKVFVYYGRADNYIYYNKFFYNTQLTLTGWFYPDLIVNGADGTGFGSAITGVGDIDQDGIAELAVSAPATAAGKAYIFKYANTLPIDVSQAMSVMDGEAAGDMLGSEMTFCKDLNMDNFPDFALSAPGSGKVYIVMGGNASSALGPVPANGTVNNAASVVIQSTPGSGFGAAIDCGSDLNGDGIADLVIGAPRAENGAGQAVGAAYVFLAGSFHVINFSAISARNLQVKVDLTAAGKADLAIFGDSPGQKFGQSVALLGDVTGRSLADLSRDFAVSAPGTGTGKIYLFYGGPVGNLKLDLLSTPVTTSVAQTDVIITGIDGEVIGDKVSGKADLNGDGHYDLLTSNGNGAVRAYYLMPWQDPSLFQTRLFQAKSAVTAFSLLPDFTSDGTADLLLGVAGEDRGYLLK